MAKKAKTSKRVGAPKTAYSFGKLKKLKLSGSVLSPKSLIAVYGSMSSPQTACFSCRSTSTPC